MRWRWVVLTLLVLVASISLVSAVTMECPDDAAQGTTFTIKVKHPGATDTRLFHHDSWHSNGTEPGIFSVKELTPVTRIYAGDAYVNGNWLNCQDASCRCEVDITSSDTAGNVVVRTSSRVVNSGDSITITAIYTDVDGTRQLKLKKGINILNSNLYCNGADTCTVESTDNPTGDATYTATGLDTNYKTSTGSTSVTVLNPEYAPVFTDWRASDNFPTVGDSVTFTFTATDDDGNLKDITTYFGDGQTSVKTCSGGTCTATPAHVFTSPSTFNVYAIATDLTGKSATSTAVPVQVSAEADSDADGIDDDADLCPNTPTWARPVVTSGDYLGCACQEITAFDTDPTRDTNACTDDSCSIVSGSFVAVHTPKADGEQPEGMKDGCSGTTYNDYYCQNGAVVTDATENAEACGGCTAQSYKACWDNDIYWYDSCDNREATPQTDCGVGYLCDASSGTPVCVQDAACMTNNDCPDGTTGEWGNDYCFDGNVVKSRTNTNYKCVNADCQATTTTETTTVETCTNGCADAACLACDEDADCSGDETCEDGTCTPPEECPPTYVDNDGDGHAGTKVNACGLPTTAKTDCNDNDPSIYQGAYEACDGKDNDCDGSIDEETDKQNDNYNCGSCGRVCLIDQECISGVCRQECSAVPGCLASAPSGAVTLADPCPTDGQACYTCPSGTTWDQGQYKCVSTNYRIEVTIPTHVAGESFVITPTLIGPDQTSVLYYYSGFRTAATNQPLQVQSQKTEVGIHRLTITAKRVSGNTETTLASVTKDVALTCPSNVACCIPGNVQYEPDGTPCATATYDGTCQNHQCQPTSGCVREGSAFGNCNDGIDNDRDGVMDCIKQGGQVESGCDAYCQGLYCKPTETRCGQECTTLDDRDHCGACNNVCNSNELCEYGTCTPIEDCYVACDADEDCDELETCRDAGTCDAYCTDAEVLELEPEEEQALIMSVVRQKTYEIKKWVEDGELHVKITALLGTLENTTLTINIPKEYAKTAAEIQSLARYDVLHDDPVIRTNLGRVSGHKEVIFSFVKPADGEYIENVIVTATHNIIDLTKEKKPDLEIRTAFKESNRGTEITLTLNPGEKLTDVRIPLEIPKCLAQSMRELDIQQENYAIINDDPLMVWTFDELDSTEKISFTVPKTVDQECKDQLRAYGLAGAGQPISPWLLLAIIPIIGVLLVFFQRFHGGGAKEVIDKKEYYEKGRKIGESEEELERGWAEYKRRF